MDQHLRSSSSKQGLTAIQHTCQQVVPVQLWANSCRAPHPCALLAESRRPVRDHSCCHVLCPVRPGVPALDFEGQQSPGPGMCSLRTESAAGRQQLAAQIAQQASQVPPQHPAASEVQRFQFDRPSPDDLVQRAQIQRGAGASDQSWLSELSTSSPAGYAMPPAQPQYRPLMGSVAAQSAQKAAGKVMHVLPHSPLALASLSISYHTHSDHGPY